MSLSTTHKLLKIPELLNTICKYSECQLSPQLLRVSRAFFLAGVPLVWQEVVGVQNLLRLLPDVSLGLNANAHKLPKQRGYKEHILITVFGLGEATDFTRFDLYARFVKRLKMFSPNTSGYQVKRWRQLSEQAQHRVFLPSLLELTIAPSSSLHPNIFLWIRTFLSPSLTSIVVEAGPEGSLFTIPGLVAKSLLGHIETTCDNLQRLQLFTAAVEDCETTSERTELAIADFWEHSFFERLGGLRLQKLGCTTELLSFDWIHLLGELPTLKSLDLYTVRCEIADQPEDLPHLEHFGIHFASSVDIELIAELGLLSGLKSLTMSFKEIFSLLMEDGWEKSIITSISRDSPELTKLHVDFTDACDCVPKMSSFRPLGALPLTEVCFKGGINVENDQMEDLAATWPNVIRFELWDTDGVLGLKDLRRFTTLPRLQHLALGVSWYDGIPRSIAPAEPSHTLRTFKILNHDSHAGFDVTLLAQYLLSLWPNLESVRWPQVDNLPRMIENGSNEAMKALSSVISSQRNFNRLRTRIIEECGLSMLDKLLK